MDRYRDTTSIDGTPLPPPAPRGTPAIRLDLVRSVRLHPVLAASVAAVTFAVIAGYAITRKPVYKAEALVYVEPITAKILSDGSDGLFDATRYESYLQQQIQTVQRPDILQAAVESLPIGYWHFPGESTANAANRLGNSLKVERQGTSFQVSLSLMGPDPVGTAAAVNAVTTAYLQKGRKDETTRTDGRVQLLQEERDRLTAELQADRAEQVTLGSRLGVANPVGPTADAYDTDLSSIRAELVAARQAHDVAAAQLASVTGPNGSNGMAAIATENSAGDPGLQALKTSFSQRRAALTMQMSGLTPGNPIYKQDQAELAQLDQQLAFRASLAQNTSAQQLRDRLRLDLKRTGDVEARLNSQLAHSTALATGAAPKLQRASELASDLERLQARYAAVDNALRGLLLEANGPGVVHLSVAATPPLGPEPSRRNLLLLASVPLALLFGAIAAVLARRRAGRVYTEADLEPILGFTPIGTMPYAASLGSGESSEYLLRLAAGLERAHRRGGQQTFVFTAASPTTDSASFVAAMARELERLGFRVKAQSTGQLLRSWDRPSSESEVLVAGIRQGIGARLDALKQRTDFVLLDAPPLLHSAETEYFLSAVDVTVLLIESGVTTERELCPAMDLLRKLRVGGLAAVLLNVPAESGSTSYATVPTQSYDRLPVAPGARTDLKFTPAVEEAPAREFSAAIPKPSEQPLQVFKEAPQPEHRQPATQTFVEPAPIFIAGAPLLNEQPTAAKITQPSQRFTEAARPVPNQTATQESIMETTENPRAATKATSSDEDPEPFPDPPSPSGIRRLFSLFHHDREPVNPFSFVPNTYDGADPEPAFAAAPPPTAEVVTATAPSTPIPVNAPAVTVFEERITPPAPASTPAHVAPPIHAASEAEAAATPAPSMLLWQAHIPHRAAKAEPAAETAFTAYAQQIQSQSNSDAGRMTWTPIDGFRALEPSETAAPQGTPTSEPAAEAVTAVRQAEPIAAVQQPALDEPVGQFVPTAQAAPEAPASRVEALVAAKPGAPREPGRLPSSAERLAFRANTPTPRRPSLPSIPATQYPVRTPAQAPPASPAPAAPAAGTRTAPALPTSPNLTSSAQVPIAPRLVPSSLSAEQVAERIVSTSAPATTVRRNSRPHIMPAPPEAKAGRQWAMLSRFSTEQPAPTAEPSRDIHPRDRAAG